MLNRYSFIDIIVGVGMCANVVGASWFFFAASGTFQTAIPQPVSIEESAGIELGMTWLQPALGQAIVEQAIFERHSNQAIAQTAVEWKRAMLVHDEFQSLPGGAFGTIMHQAVTVPSDHMARVQGVMGRAIVNFTRRGIRSGVLSADQSLSDYNTAMTSATEARGQRLNHDFTSTWQSTLGQRIVDAAQTYGRQAGAIQERLGTAQLHVTQAQRSSEEERAAQQGQLGSLLVAAVRTEALADRLTLLAANNVYPQGPAVASTSPASWPELPMGYLMVASILLAAIFGGGVLVNAQSRETKALHEMQYTEDRWVYRIAA